MVTYTKNKQTGRFDLIGLQSELREGAVVTVSLASGKTKKVTVGRVSKPFLAKFGNNQGKQCVIATVASSGGGQGDGKRDGGPRGSRPCYMCGSYYCEGARGGLCDDD